MLLLPHLAPATLDEMHAIANHRNYDAIVLATPGLQSYWKLNEASGNFADSKGAITGIPTNITRGAATLQGPPITDLAATFPGSGGSRVDFGDVYDFTGTNPFSVELWCRPASITGTQQLIVKRAGSGTDGYILLIGGGGAFFFQRHSGGAADSAAAGAVTIGSVQHAVGTYDGTTLVLYQNGLAIASTASSRSIADTVQPLRLGVQSNSVTSGIYNGDMSRVSVYNRALLPAEVIRRYRAGRNLV